MNIIFLDDDYMINRFHELTLSTMLREMGCSIEFHDDPTALIEKCSDSNTCPDLIFLDINMPLMDGWSFMDAYNLKNPNVKTKFVILTTSNDPSYKERSNAYCNVIDFANKPLQKDKMKEIVEQIHVN